MIADVDVSPMVRQPDQGTGETRRLAPHPPVLRSLVRPPDQVGSGAPLAHRVIEPMAQGADRRPIRRVWRSFERPVTHRRVRGQVR